MKVQNNIKSIYLQAFMDVMSVLTTGTVLFIYYFFFLPMNEIENT
jgi:hypothetical protein